MSMVERILSLPAEHEKNVFGQFDEFIKKIERTFHVTVLTRDGSVRLIGDEAAVTQAERIIEDLGELSKKGNTITMQQVDYELAMAMEHLHVSLSSLDDELICHTTRGKPVRPKTLGQKKYVDSIRKNMITFGTGPAGTGKTYLAMAMAVTAFKNEDVSRIIMTRPAIEAGEKLGFLPGDLQS